MQIQHSLVKIDQTNSRL